MKILFYNVLVIVLLPFMVFRIFLKSIKDKDYSKNIKNRIGIYDQKPNKNLVWFYAESLGEVISSENIIKKILSNHDVVLTVFTPTGLREAEKIYKDKIIIVYAPWDFFLFVDNFIKQFNPISLILFETEIWPNMINLCHKKNIPVIISNARLSESSFRKYHLIKFFIGDEIKKINLVLAQSNKHKKRFIDTGVLSKNIKIVGSTKFEGNENFFSSDHSFLQDKKFILAASTHYGEEEKILDAFHNIKDEVSNLKLIIDPRHPERTDEILQISKKKGICSKAIDEIPRAFDVNDVIVINATGILKKLYSIANISFIGGSLFSKYGGHNIIEAASNKCAFIIGPYYKNFEDIIDLFKSRDGCMLLNDTSELSLAFKELLNNDELRTNLIDNAYEVVLENQGSSDIQFKYINNEINNSNN